MAKNMLKKKQRIAHNKTLNEEHKMYSESDDFLSTIIEGMDKNDDLFSIMDNKFHANLMQFNKTYDEKKTQSNMIPISKQNRRSIKNSKSFGLSRKFPLMEKSQRALKQIRHNRKMPKPRAHLAGLSNSIENNQQFFGTSSLFTEKSKKTKVVAKNSKFQNKKVTEKLSCRGVSSQVNSIKKVPADKVNEKIGLKKHELPVTNSSNKKSSHLVKNMEPPLMKKKSSIVESSRVEKNDYDKTGDNSSDSEDYERFIRKEKKMLPKKSKNHKDTKKQNLSKIASKKRVSKAKSKTVVSETDSDQSDEECTSYCKNKRIKSSHKVLDKISNTVLEASESQMDVIETFKNHPDTRKQTLSQKTSKKHASKANSKTVVSETDSDQSEESTYCKNKRIVSSHKVLDKPSNITLNDSESEMDAINDETYHNSSSDSDELLPLSEILDNLQSNNFTYDSQSSKQMDTEHNSTPELNSSLYKTAATTSVSDDQSNVIYTTVCNNSNNLSHNTSGILSVNNIESSVSQETSGKIASGITLSESNHSKCMVSGISLIGSDQSNVSCSIAKNDSVLNDLKYENSNKSLIVDLTESDNEENSFTVMPKIVMTSSQTQSNSLEYSDESDIELVDVIVSKLQTDAESLDKNAMSNFSSDNSINKLSIKTEIIKTPPCTSQNNFKPINELHTSFTTNNMQSKCEITHATNKNKGYGKNEFKYNIRQLNVNNDPSSVSSNKDCSFVLNKVKKEPSDIEIILDTNSKSNSTQNLPNVQVYSNTSIKIEKDSKAVKQMPAVHVMDDDDCTSSKNKLLEKEQKLHEVACSNLKNLMNMHNANLVSLEEGKMSELHSIDIKAALQNLKKEFATYQEILQTEESVGATFKMLEKCQAERLKSLKTQITKCLSSSSINNDNFKTLKEMNKMLNNAELNEVPSVCPSMDISKSDISILDLKDGNLVPLSSISANDIKPDLTQLQSAIKKEASTSNDTSKSFGQICIVCAKAAAAACQQCAKVFFCSDACGKKYWEDGHRNNCKSGS